jgi:hypothetical protein
MRAQAKPPRRKWPWILVGVILAALVAYAIYAVATSSPTPVASPTPTESTQAPAAEPTGCLIGPGLDAATLTETQAAAVHETSGAVEVAAALMRWAYRYPYPSAGDANEVSGSIISSEAPDSFRDLAGFFAGSPNLSGGIVPDGTDYRLSTVTGVWNLESEEPDVVTVSVGANFVVDDQISSSLKASTTVTLRWEDGAWRADQLAATRTTEELFEIGTPFTGGC